MAGSVVVTVGDAHEQLMPAARRGDPGAARRRRPRRVASTSARSSRAPRATGSRTWIERGVAGGATLVVDGRGAGGERRSDGAFVGPTILDDVTPEMEIAQEEVFGPVLTVIHAASLDEAIEIVNASRVTATAPRSSPSPAPRSAATATRSQAGMIGVNIGVAAPVAFFPFSGWKDSFLGDLHAHGPDAVDFYTRKKTITSRYFSSGQGSGSYFVEC